MSKIKNFIFDFGGVLYSIDQKKTLTEFSRLSKQPELLTGLDIGIFYHDPLFLDYEKGNLTSAEFRYILKKRFFIECSDYEFDKAWNATLLAETKEAYNLVSEIKKSGKVILLSNTNEIHYVHFFRQCERLFTLFDDLFISFKIHKRKPEPDIFLYTLDISGFKPHETLFVDDSQQNLNAAKALGINTFLVENDSLSSLSDIVRGI